MIAKQFPASFPSLRDRGTFERSARSLILPCAFTWTECKPSVVAAGILALALSSQNSSTAAASAPSPLHVAPSLHQLRGRILRRECTEKSLAAAQELRIVWGEEVVPVEELTDALSNRYLILDALAAVEMLGRPADSRANFLLKIDRNYRV